MLTLGKYPKIFSPTVLIRDSQRQDVLKDSTCDSWNYVADADFLRYQYLYASCPACIELSENRTPELISTNSQVPSWHHHHQHHLTSKPYYLPENVLSYQPDQSEKLSVNKSKIFMCPYCSVTCSNRGQLLGHVRIHTGERPFVCQEPGCNKAFIRNEELTRHRRIHTGERPYRCTTCSKAFTRKDHLNKHVKIHVVDDARSQ